MQTSQPTPLINNGYGNRKYNTFHLEKPTDALRVAGRWLPLHIELVLLSARKNDQTPFFSFFQYFSTMVYFRPATSNQRLFIKQATYSPLRTATPSSTECSEAQGERHHTEAHTDLNPHVTSLHLTEYHYWIFTGVRCRCT
jgi:hypothetical protein